MQQLTGLDTLFISQESERAPMHLASLLICDPSTAPGGQVRFKDILRMFEARLHLAPIFRRKLVEVPFGLDYPYWVEDGDFDLEFHVRHIALPRPGDWRQLCIQVARLHARIIDRSRPLWECYVIEGLDNIAGIPRGCFALFLKMHHAAIDGVSGAEILGAITDIAPGKAFQESPRARRWRPEPEPNPLLMLGRAGMHAMLQPLRLVQNAGTVLSALQLARRLLAERRDRSAAPRAQTRFNGRIDVHRSIESRRFALADVKAIRDAVPGTTINDVVLAIVAGALRTYLLAKDELPASSLVAGAPINVRRPSERGAGGNLISMMTVSLCTDVEDPLERLHLINADAQSSKEYTNAVGARTLTDLTQTVPPRISALGVRAASESLLLTGGSSPMHTIISNVPGPQQPVYLCDARLIAIAGCGPIHDHMGLFHSVLSYAGYVTVTAVACRRMLPDPAFYASCIEQSFDALLAAANARRQGEAPHARRRRTGARSTTRPTGKPRRRRTATLHQEQVT